MEKLYNSAVVALLVVFLLTYSIQSCRDQNTPLPLSIEDRWRTLVPAHPPTDRDFRNGILTRTVTFAGQPVASIQRTYVVHGDTLFVGGDVGDPQRAYLLRFVGDGAVEVRSVPADTLALGSLEYWERM